MIIFKNMRIIETLSSSDIEKAEHDLMLKVQRSSEKHAML